MAGAATLPWTFLGALLLNLWVAAGIAHRLDPPGIAAALVIAAGSTLQAGLGGAVLRRAIGYPAPLDNGRDLLRFLLISPAICLVSATLSLTGMLALGAVAASQLGPSWATWWVGDTLGVLVFLPLMLVLAGEPRALWRRRAPFVAAPMLLSFALFVAIFARVSSWEHDRSLLELRMRSQHLADMMQASLEEQSVFLEQLGGALMVRRLPLTRDGFRELVHKLLQRFPTIQAVEWAPRVAAADRDAFEAERRGEIPGFTIRERDAAGELRPAGERAQFFPVTYFEPLAGNEEAVGFDLASDSDRQAAIEAATASGNVTATAPIRLVQEHGQQPGLLLTYAVPSGPNGPGIVLVVLRMGTFTNNLLGPLRSLAGVRFVDSAAEPPLYDDLGALPERPTFEAAFPFGTRYYILRTEPSALYLAEHGGWESWFVLAGGVLGTGLLGALLILGTGHAHRSEQLVAERTRELRAANRRLTAEMAERQRAQSALQQAQRMEAIGQVTGGVAHDFNNLLLVVSGNAELLQSEALGEGARARVAHILRAADRGQHLTRQLLAYARRQTLRPETVDLRAHTAEIADMLSRALRGDIQVTTDVAADLWPVTVDRAELELALLNVGVNARDAMPNGGTLRIEARNRSFADSLSHGLVGDFVALTLSDTGTGMPPDVLAKAAEPFFTTKEVGQGSGLGLSQVDGFAKQSGGAAVIASELGKGTAVTILLPARTGADATVPASGTTTAAPEERIPAMTVLVVDDDDDVARVTADMLRGSGCRTRSAASGREALAVLDRDAGIDLVLSDVVMRGGMTGLDLARALRNRRPELPILLATGYTESMAQVPAEGFHLLEKPYDRAALLTAIRAALSIRP
jgi:signal transduction histidine kinase